MVLCFDVLYAGLPLFFYLGKAQPFLMTNRAYKTREKGGRQFELSKPASCYQQPTTYNAIYCGQDIERGHTVIGVRRQYLVSRGTQ
jgi:hypothetical protein